MSRARRALPLRLGCLVTLWALACASAPRELPLPASDPRAAALLGGLARDADARRALRGVAQLALDGPAGSGRARQVLVLERPARLRVEVLGVLDQTLLVLTTDGERYRLLRVPERALDSGPVYPDLLRDVAGLAVTPQQAVELLLGVPLPPAGARIDAASQLPAGGVRVEVAGGDAPGRQLFEFDADGRLRRWAQLGPDGAVLREARFDDYRPLAGSPFAHEIALVDRVSGAQVRLSFAAVELNPALPAGVFDLPVGGSG
ncbi:MAG TPA: hypothetical protein VMH82_17360 [Myxococcota bacterium]|nr:hypothetical protein [Myxococcota bacterium]